MLYDISLLLGFKHQFRVVVTSQNRRDVGEASIVTSQNHETIPDARVLFVRLSRPIVFVGAGEGNLTAKISQIHGPIYPFYIKLTWYNRF